jgi:hypothetical protein
MAYEFQESGVISRDNPVMQHRTLEGFQAARRNADAVHQRRIMEAGRLYNDAMQGRVDPILIREAMMPKNEYIVRHLMEAYPGLYGDPGGRNLLGLRETMSVTDYQALFVDVLDRMYYGYYNGYPVYSKQIVKIHSLRDFRLVSRYLLDGMVGAMAPVQPGIPGDAASPWQQRALVGPSPQDGSPATSTAPIQYQPLLYQCGASVNWRAFVNDDLGIFKDLSNRLALAAARGIDKNITGFFVGTNGLSTLIYQQNYHNQITVANGATSNNPLLNTQGLIDAINVLTNMRDSGGDPIMITGRLKLCYGPAYEGTVQNVMNAVSLYVQNQGGSGNTQGFPVQFLQTQPWLIQRMDPVMLPYMPIINTGSSSKTAWFIVVDPNTQERPVVEYGFLNGFETPQIFSKVPNTMRLGGGVDPTMGDFYSMDQDMKICTVMGGAVIDGRSTVGSTGLQQ